MHIGRGNKVWLLRDDIPATLADRQPHRRPERGNYRTAVHHRLSELTLLATWSRQAGSPHFHVCLTE
eukprot:8352675-Alexandrium_andersonii.AAC.1